MKNLLYIITFVLLLPLTCGCSRNNAAIDKMVEEINSPIFRAKQAQTGLFDDTQAYIEGKQLVIKMLCKSTINLGVITNEDYQMFRELTVSEFRENLKNTAFYNGIEALGKEDMTITLIWQDINGGALSVSITPQEILSGSNPE